MGDRFNGAKVDAVAVCPEDTADFAFGDLRGRTYYTLWQTECGSNVLKRQGEFLDACGCDRAMGTRIMRESLREAESDGCELAEVIRAAVPDVTVEKLMGYGGLVARQSVSPGLCALAR